jgi:hypothetical protein
MSPSSSEVISHCHLTPLTVRRENSLWACQPSANASRLGKIVLAHAGGFGPYASMRFAELAGVFGAHLPDPAVC